MLRRNTGTTTFSVSFGFGRSNCVKMKLSMQTAANKPSLKKLSLYQSLIYVVQISSDLSWNNKHIDNISHKATRTLNFIRRNPYLQVFFRNKIADFPESCETSIGLSGPGCAPHIQANRQIYKKNWRSSTPGSSVGSKRLSTSLVSFLCVECSSL